MRAWGFNAAVALVLGATGCGDGTSERVIDNTQALPGEITLVSPGRDVTNPNATFRELREENGMLVGTSTIRVVLEPGSDGGFSSDQVFLVPVAAQYTPWPSFPCVAPYGDEREYTVDRVETSDPQIVDARLNGHNVLLTAKRLGVVELEFTGALARWDTGPDDVECAASAEDALGTPYRYTMTVEVDTVAQIQLRKPLVCTDATLEPLDPYPMTEPTRAAMLVGAELALEAVAIGSEGGVVHDAVNYDQRVALSVAWEKDVIRSLEFGPDAILRLGADPRPGRIEVQSAYGDPFTIDVVEPAAITRFSPTLTTIGKAPKPVRETLTTARASFDAGVWPVLAVLNERAWVDDQPVCNTELAMELRSLTPERCTITADEVPLAPPGAGPQFIALVDPGVCSVEVLAAAPGLREVLSVTWSLEP